MKYITESRLRLIIKEELATVLKENRNWWDFFSTKNPKTGKYETTRQRDYRLSHDILVAFANLFKGKDYEKNKKAREFIELVKSNDPSIQNMSNYDKSPYYNLLVWSTIPEEEKEIGINFLNNIGKK